MMQAFQFRQFIYVCGNPDTCRNG